MSPERLGIVYVVGAALLWSTGGVGIKAVDAPPLVVACLRSAIAAVALALWFRPGLPRWSPMLVAILASYVSCLTTFVVATKWTAAANAIFLQYSGVIWVLLLAPAVLGERLRAIDAAAIAIAFAGMGLFFVGDLDTGGRAGDRVAVLSGLCYAALVLSLRRARDAGAETAVVWGNVCTAAVLAPFVVRDLAMPPASFVVLVFLGVVQIGLAYVLFVRGLRLLPAAQASLVGMLEPIANPIWVFLLLGEVPRGTAIAGGAVVLAAIAWRTAAAGRAPAAPALAPD
jgi:drug/metabolite transporter (DMT)-like permease